MSLRAIPTLLKVGFAEAAAYRTEMVVWVLSTTMPLVMMLLWTSIADVAPVQGQLGASWSSATFISYFLCVFIVRQLVAAWAAWEINFEVRQGTLALRLFDPLDERLGAVVRVTAQRRIEFPEGLEYFLLEVRRLA